MEPTVRTGRRLDEAVRALRTLVNDLRNVVGLNQDPHRASVAYITWVEIAERQLRLYFSDEQVWRRLHSDRHWRIRELEHTTPRPHPLVELEATAQAERLEALADRLERWHRRLTLPVGSIPVVPDTNVLVHYRRLDELPWSDLVGGSAVCLVLPLLVIDELDDLSHRSREISDRARGLLRFLHDKRADAAPEDAVEVRPRVSMRVLIDPPGWVRSQNSDDELLRRVDEVAAVNDTAPVVVTGDYGMQLRARARDIQCVTLPDHLRLSPRGHASAP